MRVAVLALLVACVVPLPASAASIEPQRLVFTAAAVPVGFHLAPRETGIPASVRDTTDAMRARLARWGRQTGYQAVYRRGAARIESRADVFRNADGARRILASIDLESRKAGFRGQRRASLAIGSGGFVHWVAGGYTVVIWRQGRVFSGVVATGIPKSRTIALARAQAERIERELGRMGP
jgi:hypothetical protein